MVIRQATNTDQRALENLLTQLGYPPEGDDFVLQKIKNYEEEGYHLLVCDADDGTIGFAALHWFDIFHSRKKVGRITAICVSDDTRGNGAGQKLLLEAGRFLATKGCSQIEVTTNVKRTRTAGFYLKNGYSENSRHFSKPI